MRIILFAFACAAVLGCEKGGSSADMSSASASLPEPAAAPQAMERQERQAVAFSREGGAIGAAAGAVDASRRPGSPRRPPNAPPEQSPAVEDPAQQSMIIRTGNATVEVDSLELAVAQLTQLANRLGGHVASSSSETGRKDYRMAQLTLRIPAAQFDAALGGLTPIGKVESQNVNSEDVTEQYVDMSARMTNAKRLEERLISLLANRTGKLEEVLAVERELARVREEIERYEGRLRYLRTRAAISTLTVTLHEPYPIAGGPRGSNVIVEAFKQAWRGFVQTIAAIIAAMGVLIPLLIVLVLVALVLRKLGWLPHLPRRGSQPDRVKNDPPVTPPHNPT